MDLIAIAPATRTVALGSAAVDVTGINLRKLTEIIVEYPDLVGLFVDEGGIPVRLIAQAAPAALAIFSLAVIGPAHVPLWRRWLRPRSIVQESDLIAAFEAAPAGQQIAIIATIADLTFKGGERALPFLRSLRVPLAPAPAPNVTETPAASTPDTSKP